MWHYKTLERNWRLNKLWNIEHNKNRVSDSKKYRGSSWKEPRNLDQIWDVKRKKNM